MRRTLLAAVVTFAAGLTPHAIAQQPPASVAQTAGIGSAMRVVPRPGARAEAFRTTIQGNALTSANGQLANTVVRLRDARFGRIVDREVTDKSGLFAFRTVDPGSYVVEIMGTDETSVLAASELLNVNAGDVVSAVVKLPFRLPFAGLLGGNVATAKPATAIAIIAQAAANGVLAVTAPAGAATNCAVLGR